MQWSHGDRSGACDRVSGGDAYRMNKRNRSEVNVARKYKVTWESLSDLPKTWQKHVGGNKGV